MRFLIHLSPVCAPELGLSLSKRGAVLIVNGIEFDFRALGNGDVLPHTAIKSDWFSGDVSCDADVVSIILRFPHKPGASEAARFPAPIHVTEDGPVELPV
ncbi:hypothetical protein [Comamonas fluminis]|uniref:hypothetical protein n=1 Tax=Comamonas fluminis TaxID=2796366 RepID=UPI001C4886E4|nr:hypothetical protein [Comamonas fluminis]